jgi:serine/threonine-protein kinase
MPLSFRSPHSGDFLHHRYQLTDEIGSGAMGTVYQAIDLLLSRIVAIKFIDRKLVTPSLCDRFEQEAKICAQLGQRSIHIVKVEDYGVVSHTSDEAIPFYVMEYLAGENLRSLLRTHTIDLPRFLNLVRQICFGLKCAHEGIQLDRASPKRYPVIHRDIKPSNILICPNPLIGELVKVLDFGISELLQAKNAAADHYTGTPAYSAPEQMEGQKPDARSDIYSLGVMMYEMLVGRPPFQPPNYGFGGWYQAHHQYRPLPLEQAVPERKIPSEIQALVLRCLSKSPDDRPQSIAEVLRALGVEAASDRSAAFDEFDVTELEATQPPVSIQVATRVQIPVWSRYRPIGRIFYAEPLQTKQADQTATLAAVWAMLPHAEIQTLQIHQLYNQIFYKFVYVPSPHPMLLWVTAILNRRQSLRYWFPCCLDLKSPPNWKLVPLLAEQGEFQMLLFDLEPPHGCGHTIQRSLTLEQRTQLQQWAIAGLSQTPIGTVSQAKKQLAAEYERIRTEVERRAGF